MLKGKKILIGISGSIAAYKIASLIRLLVKQEAEVKVIMTPSAKAFISPLTLSTLSKNAVLYEITNNNEWANHVMLGRWADIMLIAPLSCNTLSKMANGLCDNLLMAVYLSSTCKVAVAPAMDEDMWLHPSTKKNLALLESYGNAILPVDNGELASGLIGEGRMAEPEKMIEWLQHFFFSIQLLKGKKVLVTAGPTYEPIDPVRFIGNHSTGKMGIAIANAFKNTGAEVYLVLGPTTQPVPYGIHVTHVTTADEMYDAAVSIFPKTDFAVLSAAVADFKCDNIASQKIKKSSEHLHLTLEKTKDILKTLGEMKKAHQCLVGFALETENEEQNALQKLVNKNADFIVLNSLRDEGAGFGSDTNKITVFNKQKQRFNFPLKTKSEIADDIVKLLIQQQ